MNNIVRITGLALITLFYAVAILFILSPSLTIANPVVWVLAASCFLLFGIGLRVTTNKYFGSFALSYCMIGIAVLLVAGCIFVWVYSLPQFHKEEYAVLSTVEQSEAEDYTMDESDLSWMPEYRASQLANEAIEDKTGCSLSEGVLQMVNGEPVYVYLAEYEDGRPSSCVKVSLDSEKAEIVSADILYTPDGKGDYDVEKGIRKLNPFAQVGDTHLELNDESAPCWVTYGYKPAVGIMGGKRVSDIYITDPGSGEIVRHTVAQIPAWVDYCQPVSVVIQHYNKNAGLQDRDYTLHDEYILMPRFGQIYAVANIHYDKDQDAGVAFINVTTGTVKQYPIPVVCSDTIVKRFSQIEEEQGVLTNHAPILIRDNGDPYCVTPLYNAAGTIDNFLAIDGSNAESYGIADTVSGAIGNIVGLEPEAGATEDTPAAQPETETPSAETEGTTSSVISGFVDQVSDGGSDYVVTMQAVRARFHIDKGLVTAEELEAAKSGSGITLFYPMQYNGATQDAYGGSSDIYGCVPGVLAAN